MSVFDEIYDDIVCCFEDKQKAKFEQYKHKAICKKPCIDCDGDKGRIFDKGKGPKLPRHPFCDCYYEDIKTLKAGTISVLGKNGPDYYLKKYGKLTDYYITKDEAINTYGWNNAKNTVAGKAPNKMIGGDIFDNKDNILPKNQSRIWNECDVDYFGGKRNSKRIIYSNDGLVFYTTDHYEEKYYLIELGEEKL